MLTRKPGLIKVIGWPVLVDDLGDGAGFVDLVFVGRSLDSMFDFLSGAWFA